MRGAQQTKPTELPKILIYMHLGENQPEHRTKREDKTRRKGDTSYL